MACWDDYRTARWLGEVVTAWPTSALHACMAFLMIAKDKAFGLTSMWVPAASMSRLCRSPSRRYTCSPPKFPTFEGDRSTASVSKRYKDMYLPSDFVKVSLRSICCLVNASDSPANDAPGPDMVMLPTMRLSVHGAGSPHLAAVLPRRQPLPH